jgi:cell division protein FtsZ
MGEMGKAMMGTGEAGGEDRAIKAAEAAISNPLLDDVSMKGARGVLINITGGMDMTLFEVDQAANRIREEVDPEAQIKVGSTLGEDLEGRIRVSVIATGIDAGLVQSQRSSSGAMGHLRVVAPDVRRAASAVAPSYVQPVQTQPPAPQVMTPSVNAQSQYFTMPQAVTPQNVPPAVAPQQAAPQVEPVAQTEPVAVAPAQATAQYTPPIQQQAAQPAAQQTAPRYNPNIYSAPRAATQPQSYAPPAAKTTEPSAANPGHAPFDMRVTQLTTPAQQAAADQRRTRRSESLFTRITGFGLVRPSAQQEEDIPEAPMADEVAAAQPQLGINPSDRPALSSDQSPDLLDIPAFLRRQTNH